MGQYRLGLHLVYVLLQLLIVFLSPPSSLEAVYRSRWALLSYSSFVFSMALLAEPLGGVEAMVVSAGVAGLVSYLVFRLGRD